MVPLVRALGSVKLFLVLLALFLVLAVVGGTIPDGEAVLRSVPAVALLVLMEINLAVCTIPRLTGRLRRQIDGRARLPLTAYAADVIHLGLLIAIAGGAASTALRVEQQVLVPTGSIVELEAIPGGGALRSGVVPVRIADSFETVDDGVVTGWTIVLDQAGAKVELTLNRPVSIAGRRLHFVHWSRAPVMVLRDDVTSVDGRAANRYRLRVGEGLQAPDGTAFHFAGTEPDTDAARIDAIAPDGAVVGRYQLPVGGTLGAFVYVGAEMETLNGFTAGWDPGRPLIHVGLVLVIGGMGLFGVKVWRSR